MLDSRMTCLVAVSVLTVVVGSAPVCSGAEWRPAEGPLMTRWAKQVSPGNVHAEYPRPQLVRKDWTNLNGLWDYAIRPKDADRPERFDGRILVPFPVESALSGVMKKVGPENRLWYRRTFKAPTLPEGGKLMLHFGAVDWHAQISVNGKPVGDHKGGYDAFTCDITQALDKQADEQEIVISVWDPTDAGYQPRGKQVREPRGIWYTSVTGIWQTVWLEAVPAAHIRSLKITPNVDAGTVVVRGLLRVADGMVQVETFDGKREIGSMVVKYQPTTSPVDREFDVKIPIPEAKLWSPDSPHLYGLRVMLSSGGKVQDCVESYFGMRKIEIKKDEDGFNRLFLNGKPQFMFGPLDQGWWPDGLYLAPTDEALRYDIEVLKKLGMNMCRKHVKIEPARWYYWCDKLGLMVWQDMPNGDGHIRGDAPDLERSPESEANFRREFQALIDSHYNHPCIVAWVPFNEGWGQFKTDEIMAWTKQLDPTRLVDGPSGWTDRGSGDMHDMHRYPGPAMPEPEEKRAVVLGEFGGLGWPVDGHLWWDKRNWGYRTYKSQQELQENYGSLMKKLRPLIGRGLAAAVYTQTTDVEGEVNGLMTYDRALIKLDAKKVAKIHAKFYQPQPIISIKSMIPTSEKQGQSWRYTTSKPSGDAWTKPDFDDSSWKQAPGGFGEKTTPGSVVRTAWKTGDIWLRRTFDLKDAKLSNLHLRIHHDEDAEVYINGNPAAKLTGYVTEYTEIEISDEARAALKAGPNVLAVHCHQTKGGQYVDVGLVEVIETPRSAP